jgi:aldehyde:ferredoxin oxidoreductase
LNTAGLDTISVGGVLGYVIECYENSLLSADELDGLEMTWGNTENIVKMCRKIAEREGVGDFLADGVWKAWDHFGRIGTEYAVHVQGEELPAHGPLFNPGLAITYYLAPTPGRHTQGGELLKPPPDLELDPVDKYNYSGQANNHYKLVTSLEVSQAAGLCMLGYLSFPYHSLRDQLNAVTGWDFDDETILKTGERIFTMRHLFNLREGHNPLTRNLPGRMIGDPPHTEGNVKDVTVDLKLMLDEFLQVLDWDKVTSVPSDTRLRELGMDFAIEDKQDWKLPGSREKS